MVVREESVQHAKNHNFWSVTKWDLSKICNQCSSAGVLCIVISSYQENCNGLFGSNPTIKSFIKSKQLLKH